MAYMKRFVCLFALLTLLSAPALAEDDALTYVFPFDGVRYTAAADETVLTQENLAEHADFLAAQGTTPETVQAGFAAAQTVLESYTDAGQVSLSVGESADFRLDVNVARMDEARRAQFLASFADSGLYETAAWSAENAEYIRLTYSAMYGDVPVYFLSYVTLRHGQLYTYTATVAAREITDADDAAVLSVVNRIEYLGQLATPAPTATPTPVPTPSPTPRPTAGIAALTGETQGLTLLVDNVPAWIDEPEITVTGTTVKDARVTVTVNGVDAARSTAARDGSFKVTAPLSEEGALTIGVRSYLKGEETAEKFYAVTYEMRTLTIQITEPLGVVESETSYIRGVTEPNATVYITGDENTNVRANGEGAFNIKVRHTKEGEYSYTLTAKRDGYHDGVLDFTLTRQLSYQEQYAAFKNDVKDIKDISYERLCAETESNKDKKISLRGRIGAFSDYEGMPCLLIYSANPGTGIWTNPVWVLCEEILSFEEGDIITVLGVVEGTQLPFTDAEGTQSMLPVVRMKYYNE